MLFPQQVQFIGVKVYLNIAKFSRGNNNSCWGHSSCHALEEPVGRLRLSAIFYFFFWESSETVIGARTKDRNFYSSWCCISKES